MEHSYRRIAPVNLSLPAIQREITLFVSDFFRSDQSCSKRSPKHATNDHRDPAATLTWLPREHHLP
jgi:hypothetical protein